MASKNSKGNEVKSKKTSPKSNSNSSTDSATISNLKKSLDKAMSENKKLSESYNSLQKDNKLLLQDNKALKNSVKTTESEKNALKKQSDSYSKKERQTQDKISKLQNDVANSKNELSRVKKEKDDRLSFEKQELNEKFKELKKREKDLERDRHALEKEIGVLRKLKEDTKNSANAIAKSVSKMSHVDKEHQPTPPETPSATTVSKEPEYDRGARDVSYLEELDKIFEKFAVVLGEALATQQTSSPSDIPQTQATPSSLPSDIPQTQSTSSSQIDDSIVSSLNDIFENFAAVSKEITQSLTGAQQSQAPISASLNMDGLEEILGNFAVVLKDAMGSLSSVASAAPTADNTQSAPSGQSYLSELDSIFEKFAGILKDTMGAMPATQVTAIPITQVATTGGGEPNSPESAKMMENLSSYLEKATANVNIAPPQVIITSPSAVVPPQIEGLTSAAERDPSAMISKPPEVKANSDTPIMRMRLDKDDDIYEDRLVITYTFDNMPEDRVYSKYKKILRNAVRITLLGNLQEGLELFNTMKVQNISDEYKSMIEKNISDITYYLRGRHRARVE